MRNYHSPATAHNPVHGGYPGHLADPAKNYEAIQSTAPATTCPCGQVPVCHGLKHCGIDSVRMRG